MDNSFFTSRRKYPRHTLRNAVTVVDQNSGAVLGTVANLSREGIMLVSNRPLASDNIYQLRLQVAKGLLSDEQPTEIDIGVDCLWVSPAGNTASTYWSGCQIIDVSDDALVLIQQVIQRLGE